MVRAAVGRVALACAMLSTAAAAHADDQGDMQPLAPPVGPPGEPGSPVAAGVYGGYAFSLGEGAGDHPVGRWSAGAAIALPLGRETDAGQVFYELSLGYVWLNVDDTPFSGISIAPMTFRYYVGAGLSCGDLSVHFAIAFTPIALEYLHGTTDADYPTQATVSFMPGFGGSGALLYDWLGIGIGVGLSARPLVVQDAGLVTDTGLDLSFSASLGVHVPP